jgi:hypothetical protein
MKALTKVLAMHLYSEGMGQVSNITESTFWIEGKKKNKVEVYGTHLANKIDLSSCCLCADFLLLALFDKTGDNVVLLKTEQVKELIVNDEISLVDMAGIIVYRWAVEFLPN